MKNKKVTSMFLSCALGFCVLFGYGSTSSAAETQQNTSTEEDNQDDSEASESTAQDDQEAAEQLLTDLKGTYQELWPVILADEYNQLWLDDSAAIVGDDNAEAAVEKMSSMVTGTVTGEEAVETYKDGNMAYDCDFLQDVDQFTFDGTTISGSDKDGKELFKHTYHYEGMEETRGLYIYESDDADSGEFTYFCIAPDTMDTTWHIEFRYGSDLDALGQYSDLRLRKALKNSSMLSSDVSAGYDPAFAEAFEKKNSAYLGRGIVLNKFTGARGKSGSNDANAEYVARVRRIFDDHKVCFQTAELGKVDVGGGGTIAFIAALYGMEVIDSGVSVLSMHAPWEVTSKADVYEAKKAYKAFLLDA